MRLAGLVAILLAALSVRPARPQDAPSPKIFIADSVRTKLADLWSDTDPNQVERAYCLKYNTIADANKRLVAYEVIAADPARVSDATPNSISVECPLGQYVVMHTHPPTTCTESVMGWVCVLGGELAYQCYLSPGDQFSFMASQRPFTVVQCDRHALISALRPQLILSWPPGSSGIDQTH